MHAQEAATDTGATGLDLVLALHRCAADESKWESFAEAFSDAAGCAVTLALRRPASRDGWSYVGAGAQVAALVASRVREGLGRAAGHDAFRTGFVSLGDAFPEIDFERGGFFRDWLEPRHFAPRWPLCHASVVEDRVAGWILLQAVEGHDFDPDRARAVGEALTLHFERVLRVRLEIGTHDRERLALNEVFDRMPTGVLLLDAEGRVVQANLSAERMVQLDDGLHLVDGRLRAEGDPDEALQEGIDEALDAASRGDFDHVAQATVPSRAGRRAFQLSLLPLFAPRPGHAAPDAVAAVLFGSPDAVSHASLDALGAVYGLTPAESGIVQGLVEGRTIEEIAALRKVKTLTVRGQLKQIFVKTGVSRQVDLIRLVLTGVSPLSSPSDPAGRPS